MRIKTVVKVTVICIGLFWVVIGFLLIFFPLPQFESTTATTFLIRSSSSSSVSSSSISQIPSSSSSSLSPQTFISLNQSFNSFGSWKNSITIRNARKAQERPQKQSKESQIAIAIPTKNRIESVSSILWNLTVIQGFPPSQIFVFNDADDFNTSSKIITMTVEFEANVLYQVKKKSNNKSVRLASLYHFMMESLFTEYGFEFGIFLEDDLQISPDFIEYFSLLAPLMKRDASLFCVSAFNDNGFYVSAKDESQLYRGEHFMGLGWMTSKKIYDNIINPNWPIDLFFERNPQFPTAGLEWDDYFRFLLSDFRKKKKPMECTYPQVSRTKHTLIINPKSSTHSTSEAMQMDKFDTLLLSQGDQIKSPEFQFSLTNLLFYDQFLQNFITTSTHIFSLPTISHYRNSSLVYVCKKCQSENTLETPIFSNNNETDEWDRLMTEHFKLIGRGYDGLMRGIYKGAILIRWLTNTVLIISPKSPLYIPKKKEEESQISPASDIKYIIGEIGKSCLDVCQKNNYYCNVELMPLANTCVILKQYFSCEKCRIEGTTGFNSHQNTCGVIYHRRLKCENSYEDVSLLCACSIF